MFYQVKINYTFNGVNNFDEYYIEGESIMHINTAIKEGFLNGFYTLRDITFSDLHITISQISFTSANSIIQRKVK